MTKVSFSRRNVFTDPSQPGYLYVDTEGETVRLKVLEPWQYPPPSEQQYYVYLDDTETGTNRSGKFELQIWSYNPHGTPPAGEWAFYQIFVEVYDTSNVLRERYVLWYGYTGAEVKEATFKDTSGNLLTGLATYYFTLGGDVFYIQESGVSTIRFPTPFSGTETSGYLEFVSGSPKAYFVDRLDRVMSKIGTAQGVVVTISPSSKVVVYVDVELQALSALTSIPVVGKVVEFFLWLGTNVVSYGLVFGEWLAKSLGLSGWMPIRCELVSTNPVIVRVYYSVDISGAVAAIVVAAILAIAGVLIMYMKCVRDMGIANVNYNTTQLITQAYNQYMDTVNKAIEFSKTQPNPNETLSLILSKLTAPQINAGDAKGSTDDLSKTIEQLKQIIIIIVVASILLAGVSMFKK
jgi:hypothetical protein